MNSPRLPPKLSSDPVIVHAVRTPLGKAKTLKRDGALSSVRPEDLAATVIRNILDNAGRKRNGRLFDDIIFGCVAGEGPQGYNIAQIAANIAGVPENVPAYTLNRMCASGLESIVNAAAKIKAGYADAVVAGGIESMSWIPMSMTAGGEYKLPLSIIGPSFNPHPELLERMPESYIATIVGAEILAQDYDISRKEQDAFALQSHRLAARAQSFGLFNDEITPVNTSNGIIDQDEGIRPNTTTEALAKLSPVLQLLYNIDDAHVWSGLNHVMERVFRRATVTPGNASQMTDGASAVLVMSRGEANRRGLKPLARIFFSKTAGVAPEMFGIGPVHPILDVLDRYGMTLENVGLVEINEAFAAQVIAVLRELEKADASAKNLREKLNVNGGAIALGHPLGCTGSRIATTLIHEMRRRKIEFGLESMCVGGGMGSAALFQLED